MQSKCEAKFHMLSRIFACLAIVLPLPTLAQLYTGSVSGVVSDPSGALVPNAQLRLVDEEKGFSFNAVSDSGGRYVFRQVPPATYKLLTQAEGFQRQEQSGIRVDVNQNVTVNVALQVQTTTATVEVSARATLLSNEDAVTGQVIDRKFINDLPLVGRSVFDLAYLTPGITEADTNPLVFYGNNFVSNGSRNATTDILMDGVTTTNYEQNSGIRVPTYVPSVDAVQEYKVQQSNFSAEFGFSGATVVNVVTRSGTNQFHGSFYEFFRNSKLDANNFFNNANGVPIGPLKYNDFGGTVGGPVKKDKAFFFFDYEGMRTRVYSSGNAGVPSAAERRGDFGELCGRAGGSWDSNGRCSNPAGQLWDPYTGVFSAAEGGPVRSSYIPFNNLATYMSPGNPKLDGTGYQLPMRPGNLIDPVASKLMQYYPLPNVNVGTAAYNPYNNWFGSGTTPTNNNQYDIKFDYRFSDSSLLSAKYSRQGMWSHYFNCYGNVADECTGGPSTTTAHLAAANFTHTFSPALLLNVSGGVARGTLWTHGLKADYKNLDPVSLLGMPAYMDTSGVPQLPAIALGSYAEPLPYESSIGTQAWSYNRMGQETYNLIGTLGWMVGHHELKFGAEDRVHLMNFTQPGTPGGYFYFDFTGSSEQPYSGGGDAMASFLMGVGGPGSWGQYEIPNLVSTESSEWGGFVQDNYKVDRKLTLNIGFRYDVSQPRTERYNRMNALDPEVVSPLQVPGLGTLHGGEIFMNSSLRSNYNTDYKDFQPRVGFAFEVLPKTVLRGGYGIFYSTSRSGAAGTGAIGYQGYDQTTNWVYTYQNDGATPWGRLSDPFPNGVLLPPGSKLGLMNDVGFGASGPIPSLDSLTPYEQTWSFGVQRELPGNILVDTSYIGKKGTHLYFGGASGLNYLGPEIEHYSLDQIAALQAYVTNPFYKFITNPNSPLSSPTIQEYQLLLPFPQFPSGFSGDSPPCANSIYNAFQLRLEKRLSAGLQFLMTYVFSKSIDDASTTSSNVAFLGGITSLQDPNNRELERSLSTFDIPQVLQFSYVYELPFGRGKRFGSAMHPVLNAFVGGWQMNGIWRFQAGLPIRLSLAGGQSLPTYGAQRPNLLAPLKRNTGSDWLTNYFANPEVLAVPSPYTLGNAPRTVGTVRQPGLENATLSLFKEFSISRLREGMRLQYRFEAFNALNHPNFAGPGSQFNAGNFGVISATIPNNSREVQMALKLYW